MPTIDSNCTYRDDVEVDLACVHCGAWDCKADHVLDKHWTEYPCFYASVVSGSRYLLAAGPYKTHPEALAAVDPVRRAAEQVDPRAAFYAFGTLKNGHGNRDGILNEQIGLVVERP
jgi:hypothetical protein